MAKESVFRSTRAAAGAKLLLFLLQAFLALGAQLKPTQVTFGGQSGELDVDNPPLLLGVKKDGGALFTDYKTRIEFRNQGGDVILKDIAIAGYAGRFTDLVPANATKLKIDTSRVTKGLPLLKRGETWTEPGLSFSISEDLCLNKSCSHQAPHNRTEKMKQVHIIFKSREPPHINHDNSYPVTKRNSFTSILTRNVKP